MQISPIQTNNTFNGKLYIKNCISGKAKKYDLSYEADEKLKAAHKRFHNSSNLNNSRKNIMDYFMSLTSATKDDFVRDIYISCKDSCDKLYSVINGNTYTEVNSDKFQIVHDTSK